HSLGDLMLASLDLRRPEPAGVAFVVLRAALVQPFVAGGPQPLPELACRDPEQGGDLHAGSSLVDTEYGGEALVDPPVRGLSPSLAALFPLSRSQLDGLHRTPSRHPWSTEALHR